MNLKKDKWLKLACTAVVSVATVSAGQMGQAQTSFPPNEVWPQGFYRRASESKIRWLAPRGADNRLLMCSVLNSYQMDAFGGASVVRVVGDRSTYTAGREDTGTCPWPDGIYREMRWSGIWQLLFSNGGRRYYCNITTVQHLNAYSEGGKVPVILTVPNGSKLGLRREWRGDCVWPGGAQNQ